MKLQQQAGFTLVEVLVAMVVFSVGIIAVASMQGMATFTNAAANAVTEATVASTQRVEFFIDRPYTHQDLQVVAGCDPVTLAGCPTFNMGKYQATWTVRDDFPEQGTKTVTMTVTGGAESGAIRKTVTFDRIIAQGQR